MRILQTLLLASPAIAPAGWAVQMEDKDADRDGLADFHELHKYGTDPRKADTDGDGVPDGDWDERCEYAYTVRAVMHVMAPFDVASMNDDYQDVRLLERRPDLLEFEVVVYPFNTVADALEPDARWSRQPSEMRPYLASGACSNFDGAMRKQLVAELAERDVDLAKLDDAQAVRAVSAWLLERSEFEDSFTTFAVEFDAGEPRVVAHQQDGVADTLKRFGRTLDGQWNRELFGRGMFENRIHGSCTSSAIYLASGLKSVGIPTRSIVCVPVVDANDDREVAWIDSRISHVGVRALLAQAAETQRGSWTSHTFNEVFVGGRWRRLNYAELGQNVLDKDFLGLMVHVHTFGDHSEAGLSGWGSRRLHPQHAALFGSNNPYSCVSLSDRFGAHCSVPNELFGGTSGLSLQHLFWYDSPERGGRLETSLSNDGSRYLVAQFDTTGVDGREALEFFRSAPKGFRLRSEGGDEVPAEAIGRFWGDSGDFILRIEPADVPRLERGVAYALIPPAAEDGLAWKVAPGVSIEP
jgi:hypothetical protein